MLAHFLLAKEAQETMPCFGNLAEVTVSTCRIKDASASFSSDTVALQSWELQSAFALVLNFRGTSS